MRRANPTLRTLAWVIGGLLVAGVAGLAILYAAGVPLAETQRTLPAEPGATHDLVHEILLLGFVKVRVQELVFNKGDALTGMAMSGVAIAAFVVALLIRAVGARTGGGCSGSGCSSRRARRGWPSTSWRACTSRRASPGSCGSARSRSSSSRATCSSPST